MGKTSLADEVYEPDKPLNLTSGLAYALPTMATSFLLGPIAILQGIYAKYFGMALTTIALIVLVARLFDAVTDPVIGYISDKHQQRFGSRKIFVVIGGGLFILSSYFLYVPLISGTSGVYGSVSPIYFLSCFLAFYFSWTLFEIPHLAWGGEIASNSEEKTKIYGLRALTTYVGTLLFFSVPLVPYFDTSEFTPETLAWSVLTAGLLMFPLLLFCIVTVPNGRASESNFDKSSCSKNSKFATSIKAVFSNRPLLLFVSAFFFAGTGVGMWFGLMFIFVDVYLGLGHKLSLTFLLSYGASILTLGLWYKLANGLGKNIAWGLGMLLVVLGFLGTGSLIPSESSWLLLLLCMVFINGGVAASVALAPSLLSDIIDYGNWKFGQDYGATYFSLYTLVGKANIAIGGGLGLAIAGGYGFDPSSTVQSGEALFGLRFSIAWLPALVTFASIGFILLTPLDARRHATIRRRLNARVNRTSRKVIGQSSMSLSSKDYKNSFKVERTFGAR